MDFELELFALEQTLKNLETTSSSMEEAVAELSTSHDELTLTSWRGMAAGAFSKKNDEWEAGFETFIQNLGNAKSLLKETLCHAKELDTKAASFAGIFGGDKGGEGDKLSLSKLAKAEIDLSSQTAVSEYQNYREALYTLRGLGNSLEYSSLSISADVDRMIAEVEDNQGKLRSFKQAVESYAEGIDSLEQKMLGWDSNITQPQSWTKFAQPYIDMLANMDPDSIGALAGTASVSKLLAQLLGLNYNCNQYGGDPVNMATGNFVYAKEFLKAKGLMPLSFKLFYNAQETKEHRLGLGWMHNLEVSVKKEPDQATVMLEDGKKEIFIKAQDGMYMQSQALDNHLSVHDDKMEYLSHEGLHYSFDKSGKLLTKSDRNQNTLELSYDEDEKLVTAKNNSGFSLYFSYEQGKLVQVSDTLNRSVCLEYTDDLLSDIADEDGGQYRFEYSDTKRITKITNPLGVDTLRNTYDENLRMKEQTFPDGGVISYQYDDDENALVLTEQNGNQVVYVHDDRYRSVETIYADGKETYEYNDMNLRTRYTDKRGNTTRYTYDRKGNLLRSENPLGEALIFEYNHLGKPTKVRLNETITQKKKYDNRGNATVIVDALERATKIDYNEHGKPTLILQPDLSEVCFEYDERGNIKTIIEPNSRTSYVYDKLNRVVETTDGRGNRTRYEYNMRGDIAKVINEEGLARTYEYNAKGKVVKIIDFDCSVLSWQYNCLDKPSKAVDQEGNETHLEYDLMWNISKQRDPLGNETRFEYNALNRLESTTDAKGATTKYAYDPCGNRTQIHGPRGEKTYLAYDPLHRVESIVDPSGAKVVFEYNHLGLVTKILDALGHATEFTYDTAGQKILERDPSGKETRYSYNPLGKLSEITDATGRTTKHEYYPGGLLKAVYYPNGTNVVYSYDKNKNLLSQVSQDGSRLHYEYDSLNQVVKISSNYGQTKSFTYDAVGNVSSVRDANGNVTKYAYSPTRKLTSVTNPLGNTSEYDYDKTGKLIEVKQFAELHEVQEMNDRNTQICTTRYERDELGQILAVTDALGKSETYTYDEAGNLSSKLDKEGYLTEYTYDAIGQLEQVSYADGKSVRYSYNALKQLIEIKDWLGITCITVDEVGRAQKITDHNGKKVEYTYGPSGERTSIVYPDSKTVTYQYDEALRLKALIDDDNQVSYFYDENSRLAKKLYSSGISTDYSYNDRGLLSELIHHDSQGILDQYAYAYDNMMNKTSIEKCRRDLEEENGVYQYTYDALSRLTGVVKDSEQAREYCYDGLGNRTTMIDNGIQTDYSYNALSQLTRLESDGIMQDFSYDARGNLTQVLENDRVKHTYEFSPLNRLVKATSAQGKMASYDYNGLGHRVEKRVTDDLNPSIDICYVLDLTRRYHNLLQMTDGAETHNFSWDDKVVFDNRNAYLHDELGSPLRYLDSTGSAVEQYGYDEFGNDLYGNQGLLQPFGYTGYSHDSISETYFAQVREYQPLTGRFTGVDTIKGYADNPLTMNSYTYCFDNPMKYVDTTGKFPWLIPIIIGAFLLLSGCSSNEPEVPTIETPPATTPYEFHSSPDEFNDPHFVDRTNCYAYAFGTLTNPLTREDYKTRDEARADGTYEFALQPGMLSERYNPSDRSYLSGTPEGNKLLVDIVTADAKAIGLNFQPYQPGMTGGYKVLLVVTPGDPPDYHWYRQDSDGTWSHKPGSTFVISGVTDPAQDAIDRGYSVTVGYFYITGGGVCLE